MITKYEALDILDKLEFFQGQRAGRELWFEKNPQLQDIDIACFVRDISNLREYIQTADVIGARKMTFTVIDNKTGRYPDLEEIATEEEWAQGLIYCDMEGFALLEDGVLVLCDECSRFEYCPDGRFTVVFEKGGE